MVIRFLKRLPVRGLVLATSTQPMSQFRSRDGQRADRGKKETVCQLVLCTLLFTEVSDFRWRRHYVGGGVVCRLLSLGRKYIAARFRSFERTQVGPSLRDCLQSEDTSSSDRLATKFLLHLKRLVGPVTDYQQRQ